MNIDPNKTYYQILKTYHDNRNKPERVTICNEGSTRSSKTWDFFFFLITYCDHNRGKENEIYIIRDTLVNCRDYTLSEFTKCLKKAGIWDESQLIKSPKPYYNLFGNIIFFRGLDDKDTEGYPSDILFINEALETDRGKVNDLKMRCRKLLVMDWNPKYTTHWCFDLEGQANTFFTHSTYKDNKHLELSIVKGIEEYEPWEPDSYEVHGNQVFYKDKPVTETYQPPPHPVNIKTGTADEFRWKVYGLGLRSSNTGLILKNVRYIEEFPEIDYIYGMDFGFTVDPCAIGKYAETATDIYTKLLCYHPIETPEEINEFALSSGILKTKLTIADSSDKYTSETKGAIEMVTGLRKLGWNIRKVSKTKGVMFWLNSMKRKRLNIVTNHLSHHAKKEIENYSLKVISGQTINMPGDSADHYIDQARYGHMSWNANKIPSVIW